MKTHTYKFSLIFLLLAVIFMMPQFFAVGISVFVRLFFIAGIIVLSLILFKKLFIDERVNSASTKLSVFLLSLFIFFLVLESVFMFIPKSHGIGYSLGSRLWFSKYWNPTNSFGFRDLEPDAGEPSVFFIGDSFTAGHGLKKVNERFSEIVRDELQKEGKKISVVNLGKNDNDTRGEFFLMEDFSVKTKIVPRVIVLQYFGNDIQGAAAAKGIKFNGFSPYGDIPDALSVFVEGSYFLNFIYWSFPKKDAAGYIDYITGCFGNTEVYNLHLEELKLFVDYAHENGIKLIVLVFPFFQNLELSNSIYVNRIVDFFKEKNVITIDVASLVKGLPVSETIVNNNDPHASAKVNSIVAKAILEKVKEDNSR